MQVSKCVLEEDRGAAAAEDDILSSTRFNNVFRVVPELACIEIASRKENFGPCTTCGNLEEAIKSARKSYRRCSESFSQSGSKTSSTSSSWNARTSWPILAGGKYL
eukprot:4193741-Pleurochrysis_carterae.AAC.1